MAKNDEKLQKSQNMLKKGEKVKKAKKIENC